MDRQIMDSVGMGSTVETNDPGWGRVGMGYEVMQCFSILTGCSESASQKPARLSRAPMEMGTRQRVCKGRRPGRRDRQCDGPTGSVFEKQPDAHVTAEEGGGGGRCGRCTAGEPTAQPRARRLNGGQD